MSLRAALRTSSNRAAVRLLQDVGIPKTVNYARTMGVGDVPSVPSLALGSGEVTLQSMTAAYAAFANGGEVPKPITIRRVEDRDGRVLFAAEESLTAAITPTTAFLMTSMLSDVINAGTGARARSTGFTLPAAGKTGTTNDFKDAWFVGFTPSLIAGVWVGYDQPHTIARNGFAGDIAVPMWASFMKTATRGDKPQPFKAPSGVVTASVCRLSGKLANDGCEDVEVVDEKGGHARRSMVYTEYFARDTVPNDVCDLHSRRNFLGAVASIFRDDGGAATAPRVDDAGLPPAGGPATASTSGNVAAVDPATATAAEPPKKKRGFWSKVFGIGKDDDKRDEKSDKNEKNDKNKGDKDKTDARQDDRER